MYGLTILPHMQFSPKDGVRMLRWLAMQFNSSFKLELACEEGSLKWLACQQICPDLLQNKKLSPLGTVILHITFRSALQQKNWNSSPTRSKKHTPDSANLKKLLILQERVSCIIISGLLKVHDHNLLWGEKFTSMGLVFNSV